VKKNEQRISVTRYYAAAKTNREAITSTRWSYKNYVRHIQLRLSKYQPATCDITIV